MGDWKNMEYSNKKRYHKKMAESWKYTEGNLAQNTTFYAFMYTKS